MGGGRHPPRRRVPPLGPAHRAVPPPGPLTCPIDDAGHRVPARMDTGLAVVVVLVALAVSAAVVLLIGYGRRYREEQQAIEAAERRRAAESRPMWDPTAPTDDRPLAADQPGGGWHGPSASGGFPAVPSQRTGEHDRDRREPDEA